MDEKQRILDQITVFYDKMKAHPENHQYKFTIKKDRVSKDETIPSRIRLLVD